MFDVSFGTISIQAVGALPNTTCRFVALCFYHPRVHKHTMTLKAVTAVSRLILFNCPHFPKERRYRTERETACFVTILVHVEDETENSFYTISIQAKPLECNLIVLAASRPLASIILKYRNIQKQEVHMPVLL